MNWLGIEVIHFNVYIQMPVSWFVFLVIATRTVSNFLFELSQRVTESTNVVKITDRMWARLLASTNQPSFFNHTEETLEMVDKETLDMIDNMRINSL